MRITAVQPNADLPGNYVKVGQRQEPDGTPLFDIGVDLAGETSRWRFIEGSAYPLAEALSTIRPTVIVDTASHFTAYDYSRSAGNYLADGLTLVVPHTHGTESYLRGVIDSIHQGNPPSEQFFDHWKREDGSLPSGIGDTPGGAVVSSAHFRVTGLYRDGEWQDPAELDAARAFVESRFDLRIGIWDLADNPALRTSLLTPHAVTPAPIERARVPEGSARRSVLMESERQALGERQAELIHAISEQFKSLAPVGWEVLEPLPERFLSGYASWIRLPLTEQRVQRYGDLRPLGSLRFRVFPSKTEVAIGVDFSMKEFDLMSYIESKRDVLSQIAEPDACVEEQVLRSRRKGEGRRNMGNREELVLWRKGGGWRSAVDWQERVADVRVKTPLWVKVFDNLPRKLPGGSAS